MRRVALILAVVFICGSVASFAAEEEGTRHITGQGLDMFFMNDKVFGTVEGNPLWAIYNCGSDIKGEMDVDGTYKPFAFKYTTGGDKKITGTFGSREMALGEIEKTDGGFVYHVFVGKKEHTFSIRYEKVDDGHLLNSVIEGSLGDDRELKVTVDGRLCPFATTGIILIAVGSALAG